MAKEIFKFNNENATLGLHDTSPSKKLDIFGKQTDGIITLSSVKWILQIKTRGGFLWRLWFLLSAPIIWLVKGEVKIK